MLNLSPIKWGVDRVQEVEKHTSPCLAGHHRDRRYLYYLITSDRGLSRAFMVTNHESAAV